VPDLPHGPHGPGPMGLHMKKGLHNETKDEKNVCYRKCKLLLLHLITCHNIFWPNRYTYFSQARIQRGVQGARALPRKVSLHYTTLLVFILGQFFGQIPQIFAARFARRRGTYPAFLYFYYKCPHSLLYVLRYVGRQGLHINCAHGPPQG